MIKLIILNACLNFQITGVDHVNLLHASHIQNAAMECEVNFGQCLESAKFKSISETKFKVKYRCIKETK